MSQRPLRLSPARAARDRRPSRSLAGVLAALMAGAVLTVGVPSAAADPVNPSDGELDQAATTQQAAEAEVGRITALVADAESQLEQVQVQAEAAGTAYLAAEEERQMADAAAAVAARDLQLAVEAVTASEARIRDFSRDSYMNGSALTSELALLDVDGPAELVQKAAMLQYVADHQLDVLGQLEGAQLRQAEAEAVARGTRDEKAAAEQRADDARVAAEAQLAAQEVAVAAVTAQQAEYDRQLQDAQVRLLELQGARNAYDQWLAQKRAEEEAAAAAQRRADAEAAEAAAAAEAASRSVARSGGGGGGGGGTAAASSAGYVRPTSGTITSCYGARWGVTHFGVDIAAPIGTPVYAATSGVVQRAGAATGFGLAVYIRGDDGAITVYGHVNEYYVTTGERVSAGEQIAEVGNRGQSTGPHLHFEVHPGGQMYGGQVNPVPWLRARGVAMDRCG